MPQFIARAEYVGNGISTSYPSGISAYLDVNHIKVYVDDVLKTKDVDYTFNEGNVTVTFTTPPPDDSNILIVRDSSRLSGLVNFGTGSQPVSRSSINLAMLQSQYISQEAFDAAESAKVATSAELLERVNEATAASQAALAASQSAQASASAAQTSSAEAKADIAVVQGTSLQLTNDIQRLTERVTILEGGAVNTPAPVPAPAPAPTPPPVAPATEFDFTTASLPAGATVQRTANSNAMSVNSSGVLARYAAADTPRWDYTAGGAFRGLLLERSETNELTNPETMSGAPWALLGAGVTLTQNAFEVGPGGAAGTAVLTIPPGVAAGAGGLRYGISVPNNVNIFRRVWLRSLTGSSVLLRLRTSDGSTIDNVVTVGTGWTPFDTEGVIPAGFINLDILNNDAAGSTVAVALPMLVEGSIGSDPSTLARNGEPTRPAETLTLTVADGTYSLTVTGEGSNTFTVPSVTVSGGSYVLNPATINLPFRRIRSVTFGDEGSAPAPVPPPAPPPSTSINRQMVSDDMSLQNDGGVLPGAPTNNSWHLRAFITKGGDFRGSYYPTYWDGGDWVNRYWNRLAQWFVIWPINGHPTYDINARVRIRSHEMWVWRQGAPAWELIAATNGAWVEAFLNNLIDTATGAVADMRTESVGRSFRQRFGQGWHHHGGGDAGFPEIANPDSIRGVMARFRAVLIPHDPNGPNELALARYAVSTGCDIYPQGTTRVQSFPDGYIPASSASRFKLVTNVEQPFTTVNVNFGGSLSIDGPMSFDSDRRLMLLSDFNNVPLPEFTL